MPSWFGVFQFVFCFLFCSEWIELYFRLRASFEFLKLFILFFHPFGFFCYVFSVLIYCSKIVLLPLHLTVGMSLWIILLFADRIYFHCFEMPCFVCLICSGFFSLFIPKYDFIFLLSYQSCMLSWISYLCFQFIFPSRLWIPVFRS